MEFEEYISKELPNYKEVLSPDKITQLKRFYDLKEGYKKAAETNLNTGMTSDIDKSNRYEKAMADMVRYSNILKQEIEHIKKELNPDEDKHMSW